MAGWVWRDEDVNVEGHKHRTGHWDETASVYWWGHTSRREWNIKSWSLPRARVCLSKLLKTAKMSACQQHFRGYVGAMVHMGPHDMNFVVHMGLHGPLCRCLHEDWNLWPCRLAAHAPQKQMEHFLMYCTVCVCMYCTVVPIHGSHWVVTHITQYCFFNLYCCSAQYNKQTLVLAVVRALDDCSMYRWSYTVHVEISSCLCLCYHADDK